MTQQTFLGGSISFMTFPELGVVVAVTTNISFGETRATALNIARVFAEERRR